ncbi:MAG TPA: FAD binding domain-containing protein [Myxococcota bacterium]|nr:FAD binding domain-containing protein [Myxococcota bacterium]
MLANAKVCLYPRDQQEAVRILEEYGGQALVLAGGTTAALNSDPAVTTLVDLTRIGLDSIEEEDGEWSLGCCVRIQQIATHAGIAGLCDGMLSTAAGSVGSRPIRNMTTLGGNVVQVFRWSDPPVALMAMNAGFELMGPAGSRRLSADEFFERHPRQVLQRSEILTRVYVRRPQGASGGAFIKYARTAFDLAVVDAAVCIELDGRNCSAARVVVGGTRTVPWRSREAEKILVGSRLTKAVMRRAAAAARLETRAAGGVRTDGEYRRQMVEVIAGRVIEQAAQRARERS